MLLNLNHESLTAENNFEEKKNKKQLSNYARNVRVLRHTLWNIVKHYFVRLKSLKIVDGTLIQYLTYGKTLIIRFQCFVLEVL